MAVAAASKVMQAWTCAGRVSRPDRTACLARAVGGLSAKRSGTQDCSWSVRGPSAREGAHLKGRSPRALSPLFTYVIFGGNHRASRLIPSSLSVLLPLLLFACLHFKLHTALFNEITILTLPCRKILKKIKPTCWR